MESIAELFKAAAEGSRTQLRGRLVLSKTGWLLLEVPNAIGRGAFKALREPGAELPDGGQYRAHISVMRPEEIEEIGGAAKITERGQEFGFTLGPTRSFDPAGWPEMSKCWVIEVNSPALSKLRRSYGLSGLPNDGKYKFHITFAVRRTHVLGNNDTTKVQDDSRKSIRITDKPGTHLRKAAHDRALRVPDSRDSAVDGRRVQPLAKEAGGEGAVLALFKEQSNEHDTLRDAGGSRATGAAVPPSAPAVSYSAPTPTGTGKSAAVHHGGTADGASTAPRAHAGSCGGGAALPDSQGFDHQAADAGVPGGDSGADAAADLDVADVRHILISGHSGAGKSTLGKQMAEETGMPLMRGDKDPQMRALFEKMKARDKETGGPPSLFTAKSDPESRRVIQEVVVRMLKTQTPHIMEGTQFAQVPQEMLAGHRKVYVDRTPNQVVRQRLRRDRGKKKMETRNMTPGSPLARERADLSRRLIADMASGMAQFREGADLRVPDKPKQAADVTLNQAIARAARKAVKPTEAQAEAGVPGRDSGADDSADLAVENIRHILITGMPAAGKTTRGTALAAERGMPLISLDGWKGDPTGRGNVDPRAALKELDTPSVVEGAQLLSLTPEERAQHEVEHLTQPRNEIIKRLMHRGWEDSAGDFHKGRRDRAAAGELHDIFKGIEQKNQWPKQAAEFKTWLKDGSQTRPVATQTGQMKVAGVEDIFEAVTQSESVRKWLKSQGMEPGPFQPSGNINDYREKIRFGEMKEELVRIAASSDPAPRKILRGIAQAFGIEWSPDMESQADVLQEGYATAAPHLMRWAPGWWDELHGSTGSQASLVSAIADAHRYQNMEPEQALTIAEQMMGDFYDDPLKHRGFAANELGDIYREASRRGHIAPGMDAEQIVGELTPIVGAVSAVRDASTEAGGDPDNVPAMFSSLDRMMPQYGSHPWQEIESQIRMGRYLGQQNGLMTAATQMAGLSAGPGGSGTASLPITGTAGTAASGRAGQDRLEAQNAQLMQQAAASPVMNLVAATARAANEGFIEPDSRAGKWLAAAKTGDITYTGPMQWAQMMGQSSSTLSPRDALTFLHQPMTNRRAITPEMIAGVRMGQSQIDHQPRIDMMNRAFPGKRPKQQSLRQGALDTLATRWGYTGWDNYQQQHGPAAKNIGKVIGNARGFAQDQSNMAGTGWAGPTERVIDTFKGPEPATATSLMAGFAGGIPKTADHPLEKQALTGIPDREDFGDASQLKAKEIIDLVIQRHKAQRAGEHFDYRIGTPDTGLLSWSMKPTRMPKPGEKRFVRQQPVHSHQYGSFQGTLGKGYGKGTVRREQKGKLLITAAAPDKIEFTVASSGTPERFVLLKPKSWEDRGWLLINNTPHKPTPYEKTHYKKIPAEEVEPYIQQMQEGTSVQAKLDGASSLVKLLRNGAEIMSYRVSKKTGRPIVHTERVFGCFAGDSRVELENGDLRRIDCIQAGDRVATPTGPARVLARWDNGDSNDWLEVSAGARRFAVTPNHRFYVAGVGWVPIVALMGQYAEVMEDGQIQVDDTVVQELQAGVYGYGEAPECQAMLATMRRALGGKGAQNEDVVCEGAETDRATQSGMVAGTATAADTGVKRLRVAPRTVCVSAAVCRGNRNRAADMLSVSCVSRAAPPQFDRPAAAPAARQTSSELERRCSQRRGQMVTRYRHIGGSGTLRNVQRSKQSCVAPHMAAETQRRAQPSKSCAVLPPLPCGAGPDLPEAGRRIICIRRLPRTRQRRYDLYIDCDEQWYKVEGFVVHNSRPKFEVPKGLVGTVLKGELYGQRQADQNPSAHPGRAAKAVGRTPGVVDGPAGAGAAQATTGGAGGGELPGDRADSAEVREGDVAAGRHISPDNATGAGGARGQVVPPQELGGLLNATIEHSLAKQKETGVSIKNMLYDIQQRGKEQIDPAVTPYAERRKMIQEIMQHLPQDTFGLSEEATNPEDAQKLWESIIGKTHPLTHEGVVIHPPTGKPIKAKPMEESDVHITDVFPGAGRLQGTAAGGFGYSLEPGGDRVGEVGTGLTDELRRQLWTDRDDYVGRTARIRSQEQHPSGAWRAPSLIAMHEDYPLK